MITNDKLHNYKKFDELPYTEKDGYYKQVNPEILNYEKVKLLKDNPVLLQKINNNYLNDKTTFLNFEEFKENKNKKDIRYKESDINKKITKQFNLRAYPNELIRPNIKINNISKV